MWTIFKVFIGFVIILLLLCFGFFGPEACGILVPRPGMEPASPALEGEVLTTGQPGKSQSTFLNAVYCLYSHILFLLYIQTSVNCLSRYSLLFLSLQDRELIKCLFSGTIICIKFQFPHCVCDFKNVQNPLQTSVSSSTICTQGHSVHS